MDIFYICQVNNSEIILVVGKIRFGKEQSHRMQVKALNGPGLLPIQPSTLSALRKSEKPDVIPAWTDGQVDRDALKRRVERSIWKYEIYKNLIIKII